MDFYIEDLTQTHLGRISRTEFVLSGVNIKKFECGWFLKKCNDDENFRNYYFKYNFVKFYYPDIFITEVIAYFPTLFRYIINFFEDGLWEWFFDTIVINTYEYYSRAISKGKSAADIKHFPSITLKYMGIDVSYIETGSHKCVDTNFRGLGFMWNGSQWIYTLRNQPANTAISCRVNVQH